MADKVVMRLGGITAEVSPRDIRQYEKAGYEVVEKPSSKKKASTTTKPKDGEK